MLGGTFQRVQFTPDLVPSDLVGTRIYRPGKHGAFDTELGPVFCNFLLADEINRAPAKVQSALLEVMQERQVTIGKETHAVPAPFLVMATQNPIESEGTYPLPEAQVDRFMLKVVVDYPAPADELTVIDRALAGARRASSSCSRSTSSPRSSASVEQVYVDPALVALRAATRAARRATSPSVGLEELAPYVEYGASPRGPINLVARRTGARAAARPPLRRSRRTCASSPRTSSGTGSCSATRRSPTTSTPTSPRPRARGRPDARSSTSREEAASMTALQLIRPRADAGPPGPGAVPRGAAAQGSTSPSAAASTASSPATTARWRSATAPSSPRCGRTSSATTSGRSTGT